MKCKVCGAESGKYPLCCGCNARKERGEIIKCSVCGNWHYANSPCLVPNPPTTSSNYIYEVKNRLISNTEQRFYEAILQAIPVGYYAFPQINLASFIDRTDDARFHNELFRNVDFLITDSNFHPVTIIEINDQTHLTPERKERDEKVRRICEEAGIPIIKLWTSYGVNVEYIRQKITDTITHLPILRVCHSVVQTPAPQQTPTPTPFSNTHYRYYKRRGACYVATCVYGSYEAPQVWVLRRYRDQILSASLLGRAFVRLYYFLSPKIVDTIGKYGWFKSNAKKILDHFVNFLVDRGMKDSPYFDV